MEPTWFDRELPVLEATIQLFEERSYPAGLVRVGQIAERSGMDSLTVLKALIAMNPTYVSLHLVSAGEGPDPQIVKSVTTAARQAAGQWPSPETMSDRLLSALSSAADREGDPVRKGHLRAAADALTGIGRDVLVNVMSAAATGAVAHH